MAKRTDPYKVWAAYEGGHRAVREWLGQLAESEWTRESVLPGWTVADLAAHLVRAVGRVAELGPASRSAGRAKSISEYVRAYAANAEAIADEAREAAENAGRRPAEVLAAFNVWFMAAGAQLDQLGLRDQIVQARRGLIRLGDFLQTRVIEIVVHADDLARSVPGSDALVLPRDTQRMAARALLNILVERAPGRTVEVRVPPFAAVQCVEGPRHTRGTPPNVVEMAPQTWIRLAAGRSTWAEEKAGGHVLASGERADLSTYLPLF